MRQALFRTHYDCLIGSGPVPLGIAFTYVPRRGPPSCRHQSNVSMPTRTGSPMRPSRSPIATKSRLRISSCALAVMIKIVMFCARARTLHGRSLPRWPASMRYLPLHKMILS